MTSWSLALLLAICVSVATELAKLEDPCLNAVDVSNPKRAPINANTQDVVELCDSDLQEGEWYYLGGEITESCVDFNRCSTFSGIWYQGSYPTGDEIVSGKVCAKVDSSSCCGWSGTIKVKKCPKGYVYQLAIPKECPMSYCVGEAIPCPTETVFDRDTGTCVDTPKLQNAVLSSPYISAYKMFGTFNATMFSVDCELNSTSSVMANINGKLKVETVFKMNEQEIAKFVSDFPVTKVTLEETYLVGHIGKTLTCEAQLYYDFGDGSFSTRTNLVKSSGFYFGIEAIDASDVVVKEIRMQQGVTKDIHFRSTFPITYGHCVMSDQCNVEKYSFVTSAMKVNVRRDQCQIHFENRLGQLVFKSSKPIRVSVLITPGIEHSTDVLAFTPFNHLFNGTIFQGFLIPPIQVIITETQTQPTCYSVGDPHFQSFHGVTFDNYLSGDFNLLSTKHRTFQIQVRQYFCVGQISCNCGVIAREGNNLIGISACDYRKTPVVFQLMKDDVNPTASLKITNNEYYIKFVSGISMKINLFSYPIFMNIYVNGLKHEQYEGICSVTAPPADFNVYRVPYAESFFKSQLPSCVNEVFKFPECKCFNDSQDTVSTVCEFSHWQQDTGMVIFENICDVKKRMKDAKNPDDKDDDNHKEVPLSVESKISKEGLTIDDIFSSLDRSRDKENFKDVELMSSTEAQGHCLRILEKIQFSEKCREFLGGRHEDLQKNCIDDVKLSGRADIAQTYLNIYEEVCMTTLAKEVAIVDGEKSPESKEIIDVLEEMKSAFNARQLNSLVPWQQETTTSSEVVESCSIDAVFDRHSGTCLEFPQLQNPILSNPYISAYKMFGTFNATMFSVDCELNSTSSVMANINGKLKVETVFKMNEQEIAKFVSDFPVTKVTLEETYLVGHIGKTLTCEVQLFFELNDGSFSTRTSAVTSSGYYFGIEAVDTNDVVMKEIRTQQGVTKDIYFRSTFPITYGHCVMSDQCHVEKYSFVTSAMKINVRRDQCQIYFENRLGQLVFKSSKPIRVSVLITPGIEHSSDVLAFTPFNHLFNGTIFQGFLIPPIQVIITETQTQPTCYSVGDPHFQSFHGVTFSNYLSGDFNLLSTKHRTFQIQVRQYFCVGQISCNCGVIAREGNNLIGISACDNRKAPVVFQLMKDNVNPTASLKITNNEYYIKFVSGISIKINLFSYPIFMNIYVNGLKHEQYEGICSVTAPPVDFNVYRVPYAESLFKSQLPSCVNEVFKFPECKCFNDSQDTVSTICEFSHWQQDTGMVIFENICDVKKRMKDAKNPDDKDDDNHKEEVPLSVESKISKEGLTIDDIFSSLDRSRDKENFKDVELMSSTEAQGHCLRILEKIQFSEKCREFLGGRHEDLQKNCIDDVKLSGRADIAQTYLNIYEEVCMTTLAKEVAIVDGEKSPESKEITDVLEEMNSTFNERQRNSLVPWQQETTTSSEVVESCSIDAVFDRHSGTCLEFPQLQNPILSNPYISAYKMFGTFNATMFSVDCELNSTSSVMASMREKLKVETIFKMNEQEIAKFVSDFPVTKVTLEETYLVGHIGKTLTCEVQMFFEFNDGSFSTRTSAVTSSGYYFGIEAVDTNDEFMKEIRIQQGVTKDFYLRSTFPITYGHCVKSDKCLVQKYSFVMSAMKINVRRNQCQIHFENPLGHNVFRSSKPIQVSVLITPGIEHSTDAIAFAPFMHLFNGTIFQGFLIPPIQVVVVEYLARPTCHSVADPHFMSFHGVHFDNYFSGDFNMLSAKNRTFQIQVRQIFCLGRVSCNCGVIAREGNNLIGINVCDYRSVPVVFRMMRDNVNPAASVELINNEFHMKFTSGVSIKVSLYQYGNRPTSYLNIYVNGLKHEQYDGICSAASNPADFNVYRIPLSESFFKSQLPSCVNEVLRVPECKCVTDQQNVVSAVCGFSESQQDTGMVVFENICDVKKGMNQETGSAEVGEVFFAVESKTSKEGITLDDIFNTVDRRRDDEDSKEVELMPLNEAQVHCSRILEKSKFSSYCRQFLGDRHEALQKNCIDDVKLSGTGEAAETYLNIYEEVCMTTLAKEVGIVDGEKSPESKEIIDVLAEMNTTFTERQLNASVPWKLGTKPGSVFQKLLENLKLSHVLIFSGTVVITGTAVFAAWR